MTTLKSIQEQAVKEMLKKHPELQTAFDGGYSDQMRHEAEETIRASIAHACQALADRVKGAVIEKEAAEYSDDPMGDSGGNYDDAYSLGVDYGNVEGYNAARSSIIREVDGFMGEGA